MSEEYQITSDNSMSDFIPKFTKEMSDKNLMMNHQMCSDIQFDE